MASEALTAMQSCLSSDDAATVAGKVGTVGWEAVLAAAEQLRLAPALVARLREKRAVPNVPAITLPSGVSTVTARIEQIWLAHLDRRRELEAALAELVGAMNRAGLEPVLLKGARALATGNPAWRTMRDLDLLLFGNDAMRAHQAALGLGYRPAATSTEKAGKHHFQPLFRDDFPGWIEIHQKAATHRAEGLLPTRLLERMSTRVQFSGVSARVLTPPAHTLHAVIHHHVGHRGDKGGGIDLKGLFEFCADLQALSEAERRDLLALAGTHPRLLATLDFWIAAGHAAYGMPVEPPFALYPDAVARAAIALAPAEQQGRYSGTLLEIAFAADPARLKRQPGGRDVAGRLALRAKIVSSMLRPMIDLFGGRHPDQ